MKSFLLLLAVGIRAQYSTTQQPLTPKGDSLVLRPKSQPSPKRNERRRKKWCQKYGGVSPPGEWLKHEGCTYTMVLPNTEGCSVHQNLTPEQPKKPISNIQADDAKSYETLQAKVKMDDLYTDMQSLKHEMLKQQYQIGVLNSTDANQKRIEESISNLEAENQNMNSRVQQLYMQLLHEIVKKKDIELDSKTVEKKLLNQTVHLYELEVTLWEMKEQYNKLLRHSSMQQRKIDSMQKTMEQIVTNLGALSKVVDRIDGVGAAYDVVDFTPDDSVEKKSPTPEKKPLEYRDCLDVYNKGNNDSGTYAINLPSGTPLNVLCDLGEETDSPGWIVVQQRKFGQVDFQRNWADYKHGFGSIDGDFWMGLESLYQITKDRNFELRIDMSDWTMNSAVATYGQFSLGPESDNYRLHIGEYSGNAGDSLSWHNEMPFTTKDRDNDPFIRNCAHYQNAGWWFNMCAHSNLNGVYYSGGKYKRDYNDGVYWSEWKGSTYSLKYVEIKIRPR